ncbi:MAG: membrane-bound lytic murein transglycosylase MltF [Deltaproteobacteria bacterium]|nr:membrane-bound lytic murein transglycosylase MltF [Deltaproteobacteria bacterium]
MNRGRQPQLAAGLLLLALGLNACDLPEARFPSPQLTLKPGVLTVLTRKIPTAYYLGPEGPGGFEYELAAAFAQDQGLSLEIKVAGSIAGMLANMARNEADIGAGGLTRTPEREKAFTFGPDSDLVQQLLVYRRGESHPAEISDLPGFGIMVPARSSYDEQLRRLRRGLPELKWQTGAELTTDQLLERVWRRELPLTIADSNILDANLRYYPELAVAFPVSGEQPLAWIVNPQRPELKNKLENWFYRFRQQGRLDALKQRHFGHRDFFDYVDIKVFTRRIHSLLPDYRPLFEKYAHEYQLPWTLLAAKAYQESHWNPEATSATGVRGIMMLTRATAAQMGVDDRLAPEQSIMGGARYLRRLLDRVPGKYSEKDRRNVALAAYNVGLGHIRDARKLALKLKKNPDSWSELKTVLPLLSQEKFYRDLEHGYARGDEPVRFVERVNNYRNILEKKLGLHDSGQPLAGSRDHTASAGAANLPTATPAPNRSRQEALPQ